MAVAFRNAQSANTGATSPSTIIINKPTGTAVGDLLIANLGVNLAATNSFSLTGWARMPGFTIQSQGSSCMQDILYRIADGTEGSTFTFTCTNPGKISGNVAAYSGVDNANPFAGFGSKTAAASNNITWQAFEPQVENSTIMLVGLGVTRNTTAQASVSAASSGATVESDTCTTASAFLQAFIQDNASLAAGLPLANVTYGGLTNSQVTTYATTELALRADLSSSTGLTVETVTSVNSNAATGGPQVTDPISAGHAGDVVVVMASSKLANGLTITDSLGSTYNTVLSSTAVGSIIVATTVLSSPASAFTVSIAVPVATQYTAVVYVIKGAASTPTGATNTATSASGTVTTSLTTTVANSWVWSLVFDATASTAYTLGSLQTAILLQRDGTSLSTRPFWRQTSVTPSAGTSVTNNATAPTSRNFSMGIFEIVPPTAGGAITDTGFFAFM